MCNHASVRQLDSEVAAGPLTYRTILVFKMHANTTIFSKEHFGQLSTFPVRGAVVAVVAVLPARALPSPV